MTTRLVGLPAPDFKDENVGRSVDETLQVLQVLQAGGGLCPSDWKPGQKTLYYVQVTNTSEVTDQGSNESNAVRPLMT